MRAARATITVDDDKVRVTTWEFTTDGASTGHHRHEFDYVVVPITGGTFTVIEVDGSERQLTQTAGLAYVGSTGTAHEVVNASGRRAVFVDVELKR